MILNKIQQFIHSFIQCILIFFSLLDWHSVDWESLDQTD